MPATEGVRQCQPERPSRFEMIVADFRLGFLQVGQYLAAALIEGLPFGSERDAARRAMQEPRSQPALKASQSLACCRPRQADCLGAGRETT